MIRLAVFASAVRIFHPPRQRDDHTSWQAHLWQSGEHANASAWSSLMSDRLRWTAPLGHARCQRVKHRRTLTPAATIGRTMPFAMMLADMIPTRV